MDQAKLQQAGRHQQPLAPSRARWLPFNFAPSETLCPSWTHLSLPGMSQPLMLTSRDQLTPNSPLQWYRDFEPADISDPDVTIQPDILCEACLRVGPWLQDNRSVEDSQKETLTHCKSGQALEQAYKDGCHLCTLLWHSLVEPTTRHFSLEKRLEDRNARAGQVRGGSEIKLVLGPTEYATSGDTGFFIKMRIKLVGSNDLHGGPLPLHLGPPSLRPRASSRKFARLVSPSTKGISTSTCNLAEARIWLEECTQTHEICQRQPPYIRPRRLLAVSRRPDGIHLQLKHSDELQDLATLRWVCLSYCWGGCSTSKLTRSTSTSLQQGIMADRLPKTIRDAANVVLALGLEFLWVDALCILQDSAEDWLHEAESMGDIYRGSVLTLAALGATDSNVGLFASRDPLMYSKCRISRENSEVAAIYPAWSDYRAYVTSRSHRWPL